MAKNKSKNRTTKKKISRAAPVSKKINWSLLPLLLLTGFVFYMGLVRAQYFSFGLDRDEGTYAYLAKMWINGGQMYVDGFEMKPPGIFFLYALINTIFGYSKEGLHISVMVFNSLSAYGLFYLFYSWKKPWAGFITAVTFLLLTFNPYISGFAAVSEHYMNFFLILSLLLTVLAWKKDNMYLSTAAGFIFIFNALIKQNGVFYLAAIGIAMLIYFLIKKESRAKLLRLGIWMLIGAIVGLIFFLLPVLLNGNWDEMFYWIYTYPSAQYTSAIPWERGQEYFKIYLKQTSNFALYLWYAACFGWIWMWFSSIDLTKKIGFTLLAIAAIASIFPGNRFYGHYWIYVMPVLAFGCGFLFEGIQDTSQKYIPKYLSYILPLILICGLMLQSIVSNKRFFSEVKELSLLRSIYGDNPFTELRYISDYVDKKMEVDDQVVVFGSEPQVYVYHNKAALDKNIFMSYLSKEHPKSAKMRTDFIAAVKTTKPKYVYFVMHPFSWSLSANGNQSVYQFAYNYVKQNYKPIAYADLLKGQAPKIVLGNDALNYKTQSDRYVVAFERVN